MPPVSNAPKIDLFVVSATLDGCCLFLDITFQLPKSLVLSSSHISSFLVFSAVNVVTDTKQLSRRYVLLCLFAIPSTADTFHPLFLSPTISVFSSIPYRKPLTPKSLRWTAPFDAPLDAPNAVATRRPRFPAVAKLSEAFTKPVGIASLP